MRGYLGLLMLPTECLGWIELGLTDGMGKCSNEAEALGWLKEVEEGVSFAIKPDGVKKVLPKAESARVLRVGVSL
jgi:hypothetical protein